MIIDKIVISYKEPEMPIVLWYNTNTHQLLYYGDDGWEPFNHLLDIYFEDLQTNSKTLIGAINELNTLLSVYYSSFSRSISQITIDIQDLQKSVNDLELQILDVVTTINNQSNEIQLLKNDLSQKQDKVDPNLLPAATVVNSINILYNKQKWYNYDNSFNSFYTFKNSLGKGYNTVAFGEGNVADTNYEYLIGKYNTIDTSSNRIFSIGIGQDSLNRASVFSVYKDGNYLFSDGNKNVLVTLNDLDNLINIQTLVNTNTEDLEESLNEIKTAQAQHVANLEKLENAIFSPDGGLAFLNTMMLQVGADSMNYYLKNVITSVTPNGIQLTNCKLSGTGTSEYFHILTDDILTHFLYSHNATIPETELNVWNVSKGSEQFYIGTSDVYYVCIKCSRTDNQGIWICDTTQHKVDEDSDYYYFNWGILIYNAETQTHTIMETRGCSYMYGDNLVCGRISSLGKNSYFDLTTGDFVLGSGQGEPSLSYIDGVLTISGVQDERVGQMLIDLAGLSEDYENFKQNYNDNQQDLEAQYQQALQNALAALEEQYGSLQDQIDGKVDSWFKYGTPTLTNEPAVYWDTEVKKNMHSGDTYTDITEFIDNETTPTAGKSWRWCNTANAGDPPKWEWVRIADPEIEQALLVAGQAFAAVDGKTTVYYKKPAQYHYGDLWVLEDEYTLEQKDLTTKTFAKGTILNATETSEIFNPHDWSKDINYVDYDGLEEKLDEALSTIDDRIEDLNNTYNSLSDELDKISADNVITQKEKETVLAPELAKVQYDKLKYIGNYQGGKDIGGECFLYGIDSDNLVVQEYYRYYWEYSERLGFYINTEGDTVVDETMEFEKYCNLYYQALKALLILISNKIKELLDENKTLAQQAVDQVKEANAKAQEAFDKAQEALGNLKDYTADGKIDAREQRALQIEYNSVLNDKQDILDNYIRYEIENVNDEIDFELTDFYTSWLSYSNSLNEICGKEIGETPIDIPKDSNGNTVYDYCTTYYQERIKAYSLISNAAYETAKAYASDLFSTIAIGGRNLIRNSKEIIVTCTTNNTHAFNTITPTISFKPNTEYILSFESSTAINTNGENHPTVISFYIYNSSNNKGCPIQIWDNNTKQYGVLSVKTGTLDVSNKEQFVRFKTGTVADDDNISDYNLLIYAGKAGETQYNTITIKNAKLEQSNVHTAWSAAPEDYDDSIRSFYYLKQAFEGTTDIAGGTVFCNQIHLRDANGSVSGGINGIEDTAESEGVTLWSGGEYSQAAQWAQSFYEGSTSIIKNSLPLILTKSGRGSKIGPLEVIDNDSIAIYNSERNKRIILDAQVETDTPGIMMQEKTDNKWNNIVTLSAGNVLPDVTTLPFTNSKINVYQGGKGPWNIEVSSVNIPKNTNYTINTGSNCTCTIDYSRLLLACSRAEHKAEAYYTINGEKIGNSVWYPKKDDYAWFGVGSSNLFKFTMNLPTYDEVITSGSNGDTVKLIVAIHRMREYNGAWYGIAEDGSYSSVLTGKACKVTLNNKVSCSYNSEKDKKPGIYMGKDGFKAVINDTSLFSVASSSDAGKIDITMTGLPSNSSRAGQLYKSGNYLCVT